VSDGKVYREVFGKPKCLTDNPFLYCPGCGHGLAHRLVAETIDELGLQSKSIIITSIGCSVRCWRNFDVDVIQGPHGRALAIATGVKRAQPDQFVFTYQGDGDLTSIGMAETMHAASRGEAISVVFINNAVFGATGGQMAPTTLVGQKTTTYPKGRDPKWTGPPIRLSEILAQLPATAYIARGAVSSPKNVLTAKKYVRRAFETQLNGGGFGLVEILSPCPVNLKLDPVAAMRWVDENLIPYYPLGEIKTSKGVS
jgi:2-oxoglutarate ferredoxin oxidoreductase subunit beta